MPASLQTPKRFTVLIYTYHKPREKQAIKHGIPDSLPEQFLHSELIQNWEIIL